jgi:hypothetical protein
LFLAIPAGISMRFSKSICSSRSIFSYWVPSKFLENQSVYPHQKKKKKTDEKQSTISKLKRSYKICLIQGKFASEECNSEVPVTSSKREKKMKMKKATIGYTSSTGVFLLAILRWLPTIGSNLCNRSLRYS